MRTRKVFMFYTYLDLLHGGSVYEILCRKMVLFLSSCWVFLSNSLFILIRWITAYFIRFRGKKTSREEDSIREASLEKSFCENKEGDATGLEKNCTVPEVIEVEESEYGGVEEKVTPSFSFKFQFESSEEIRKRIEETEESVAKDSSNTEVHQYQFLSEKDFAGFVEEPEVLNLSIQYSYLDSENTSFEEKEKPNSEFKPRFVVSNKELHGGSLLVDAESNISIEEEHFQKSGHETEVDYPISSDEGFIELESSSVGQGDVLEDVKFLSHIDFFNSDSDPESFNPSDQSSFNNDLGDLIDEGFLSEEDLVASNHEILGKNSEQRIEFTEPAQNSEQTHLQNSSNSDRELIDLVDESSSMTNQIRIEKQVSVTEAETFSYCDGPSSSFSSSSSSSTHGINNSSLYEQILSEEDGNGARDELGEDTDTSGDTHLQKPLESDSFDENELESLWEHQDLIEQLKMELKKVRAIGLPTILEESESPKIVEDLKPWKLEESFLQENPLDELQKFYKSYRERMRKFDILNYQKMYAIGFLHLKDSYQHPTSQKTSIPALTSLLSLRRRQKCDADPSMKLARELQNDLKTVYVGQTCLSWEFLQWQHRRARELSESDPHSGRAYNQVAGEFQQFQVVLRRFMEDEAFEGPRVKSYVKTRCILRNLLQVPALREDRFKDKAEERRRKRENEDGGVSCRALVEIMEESMRIFWEFIRADKDEASLIAKALLGTHAENRQDLADVQLFTGVQEIFQKKEKKLRELVRSGHCLVNKLQRERRQEYTDMFLSQVDMKLVCRVLRMSALSVDQLVWCQKKLSKITFSYRKVHREPSFCLFPC